MLPAGHLQDVMKSVISNDEKMQEATVSSVNCVCIVYVHIVLHTYVYSRTSLIQTPLGQIKVS